jgi:SET domain-containing protein
MALSAKQILSMPPAFQAFLARYASKEFGEDRYTLCADNARFINHSDSPSLRHVADTIVATRDIAAGEELTLNYRFLDDPYEAGNILTKISRDRGERDALYEKLGKAVFARR